MFGTCGALSWSVGGTYVETLSLVMVWVCQLFLQPCRINITATTHKELMEFLEKTTANVKYTH